MTDAPRTVLHYLGYDDDAGGIVSVVRALAATGRCRAVLGLNPGARQRRVPPLPAQEFPRIAGEEIGWRNVWRARAAARAARAWLREDARRIFHGHSRAGLLVAWWLCRWGERRVVASVHCYGRRRWFYRAAARRLGHRLFWLTPDMRRYYGAAGSGWEQCLPGGVPEDFFSIAPAAAEPDRLRLGAAGGMARWKRWELVPQALALLPPALRAQVSFEHIGGAPPGPAAAYAAELRALAGAAANIVWRGPEASSHRLLAAVDVVVVTSRLEPYSMIAQEALAAGRPVLAADSGGPRDVIVPGRNGWLFRDGDVAALAAALEQLVRTRAWTGLEPDAIRRTARRAEDVAAQWQAVYAGLD